jgi:methylaspartate mutase epsilon subunit
MSLKTGHTILLGGIGGDSHSVGLTVLHSALVANGYRVRYLGTQTKLEEFLQLAGFSNAVMLSSMDGHTRHYLRRFPELLRQYQVNGPLWYLGGNLDIGDGLGYEARFREMGFHRVFVGFVDIRSVLRLLESDLHDVDPMPEVPSLWSLTQKQSLHLPAPTSDDLLDQESFENSRREVLEGWKTGYQARNIEENAEFLARQPQWCRLQARVNAGAHGALVQPRSGVALIDQQIELFQAFKRAGAHVLSYQVDSLTRNNNYAEAELAIKESRATKISALNGFPVINHGVAGLRRIISEVGVPLQTRHSTRDPRLLAEISYAGGATAYEGGAICYNIPYYKDYPLDESVRAWQYVDRLTGIYYERFGIALDREFFGTLTATLIPPSIAIACNIIESILAIRQGVRRLSLGYAEQGNRIQDIAAIRMMKEMSEETVRRLGYKDVEISTVFHQYMAAFPATVQRAEELIYQSAVTMGLSRATRMLVKTPVEAIKIPTLQDNVHAIGLASRGLADHSRVTVNEMRIAEECELIRRETQSILDSVLLCGNGSFAAGVVSAFRKGYLDIPFSPSIYNRNEVLTARDTSGAVRFLSCGQLQFDRELREFHELKMAERRHAEGLHSQQQNYLLIEKDVLQIARDEYEHWPLNAGDEGTSPNEYLLMTADAS